MFLPFNQRISRQDDAFLHITQFTLGNVLAVQELTLAAYTWPPVGFVWDILLYLLLLNWLSGDLHYLLAHFLFSSDSCFSFLFSFLFLPHRTFFDEKHYKGILVTLLTYETIHWNSWNIPCRNTCLCKKLVSTPASTISTSLEHILLKYAEAVSLLCCGSS